MATAQARRGNGLCLPRDRVPAFRRAHLTIIVSERCMSFPITLTVNGVRRSFDIDDPRLTLLDLLRERLHLTGTM